MAASRPSFPAPSEPNLRRLGVGSQPGSDRPLRAPLVVAAIVLLVLAAVPIYLLRRPDASPNKVEEEGAKAASLGLIRSTVDAGAPTPQVKLGPIQRVKCSANSMREGNEGTLCDRLPSFDQALKDAVRKNVDCAPQTGKEGSINFVLTVDFSKKRVNVFPGASGEWKGPQAKAAAKCVKRSLSLPDWESVTHRYRYYVLAVMATYPAPDPLESLPKFE